MGINVLPPDDDNAHTPEFTCDFCGRHDPNFTPEVLDTHFWRECLMLTECEFCEQVIEISTLREHLRDECEHRAQAQASVRDVLSTQCPLCRADIGAGRKQDWRHHLLSNPGCPRNRRNCFA